MDIEQYLKRFTALSFKEVSLENFRETPKSTLNTYLLKI